MKYIVLSIIAALFVVGCQSAAPVSPLKGKWQVVAVLPGDTSAKDSSDNYGLALLAMVMAVNDADTFELGADSSYIIKDTKGTYSVNGQTVYFRHDSSLDTFTYSIANDTLSLLSTEKFKLQLKKLK